MEVKNLLRKENLLRTELMPVKHKFLVSDEPQHFRGLAARFLGHQIREVERCYV